MQYGAHLPLIEFDGARRTLDDLRQYAKRASDLGYGYLCANDHLLWGRPWIDGPDRPGARDGRRVGRDGAGHERHVCPSSAARS